MMTATVPTVAAVEEALRAAWLGQFREPTATGYVLATEGETVVLTVEGPTFVPFQTGRYDGFKDPQEGQAEWLLAEAEAELGSRWTVTRDGNALRVTS